MTFDEVLEIGREQLLEYEPRLKGRVEGIRQFDRSNARLVSEHYNNSLSTATKEVIEQVVSSVLDKLVALPDTFWMSEPECDPPADEQQRGYEMRTVRQEHLNLTFSFGYSAQERTDHLWVTCHYYEV